MSKFLGILCAFAGANWVWFMMDYAHTWNRLLAVNITLIPAIALIWLAACLLASD